MTRRVQVPNVKINAVGTLAKNSQAGDLNGKPRTKPLTLGVIHGTVSGDLAGVRDLQGVISWWRNPAAGGSAPVVIDNELNSAIAGSLGHKMPHCGQMNGVSVGLELIAHPRWWMARLAWRFRTKQLHETARWIAWVNFAFGLPIQKAVVTRAGDVTTPGWLEHRDLAALGLGTDHSDPGPWFPMEKVLGMAQWYRRNGWVNGYLSPNAEPVV